MKDLTEDQINKKLQENESFLQRKDIDIIINNCVASKNTVQFSFSSDYRDWKSKFN